MNTTYCDKCGLLHDPNDGDCQGCEMVEQIKFANIIVGYVMKFDLRMACVKARVYLKKYKETV